MEKVALITGITGQDGSYLSELLLEKGYEVHGLVRQGASRSFWRIEHIRNKINLIPGDLTDQTSLDNAIKISKPTEVYNLAAQSFVSYSFGSPCTTSDITGLGVLRLLEAVKNNNPSAKFFQASSSEMFGKIQETPQRETTRFYPRSPYGCSKAFAHHIAVNYREAYGMHISCAIMFNHESPRRGEEFVTRKITKGIANFKKSGEKIQLGNLDAFRDWGHSKDYMHGAWLMLQKEKPSDYILATNEIHSVREWLEESCRSVGLNPEHVYVKNKEHERKAEVDYLKGDYSRAEEELGWEPKIRFRELVREMVRADLNGC